MNYRIKNIESWRQLLPSEPRLHQWMNDEVHTLEPMLAEHGMTFNCIDPVYEKSMEEEHAEANPPKPEFECPLCGKVCKTKAGLTAHVRKCKK